MRRFYILFIFTTIFFTIIASAQTSFNMTLFGQIDPRPNRSSGSWGYVASDSSEYALLGKHGGTSIIAIDDSSNIHEVAFISGPGSNWREITVLGNYAYITTEGGGGMQIIYLGDLPNSATLAATYTQLFSDAHIIGRDIYSEDPFVYVMGTSTGSGVHILDVSDPVNPVQVGLYAPYYIHDAHIRGDRLYASAIWNGTLDIVDISDKSAPVMLAQITHPQAFTHSSWTSADHKYLVVTDEVDGLPATVWNINNLKNIERVADFSSDFGTLVHNPYVRGDWVFVSHNSAGIRVYDIGDPTLPLEVGYYDTHSGPSGGSSGLWSAFPYFPSGKVIGGDRFGGLYIWEFNNTKAGRIYGRITDAQSNTPVSGADVLIQESGAQVSTNFFGNYKLVDFPSADSGYTMVVTAPGYDPQIIENVVLNGGDQLTMNILLGNPVSIAQNNPVLPKTLSLYQNYPNPFNPETNIEYFLPNSGFVDLRIYNSSGELVTILANESQTAGFHSAAWQGQDLQSQDAASGIYIYRLQVNGQIFSRKMILLR